MNRIDSGLRAALVALGLAACATMAFAQAVPAAVDAAIRKNLGDRLPQLGKIDEVNRTPMPGLYEVRIGLDLVYSDAEGNFVVQGQLFDAKQKRNLTEDRLDKLLAIDFDSLPVKDAFTIVRGNGKRKMAAFADPNCGYCKRFERDLLNVDNVTVYMFLYPILGSDSTSKSQQIWCAKDRGKAWLDWMVRGQAPEKSSCDTSAITRNIEYGKKLKITGTPTLILADGSRVPGAIPAAQVEKLLAGEK
jgi:thiol:disulfide interchange protein DsbC